MTPDQQRAIAIAKARKAKSMASQSGMVESKPQPSTIDKIGAIGRSTLTQGNIFMGGPFSDEFVMAPLATLGTTGARLYRGEGINSDQIAKDYTSNLANINKSLQKDREIAPIGTTVGEFGGNILTGGSLGLTKTGQNLASLYGNSGLLGKMGISGLLGSASSGLYSLGSSEGSIPERAKKTGLDQASIWNPLVTGGLIGGAIPVAGAGFNSLINTIAPKADEALRPLVQTAINNKIPLRADQVSPTRTRKTIQKVSQALPGSGADAFEESQRLAWNKSVSNTIGAEDLSPENFDKARKTVSAIYEKVLSDKSVTIPQSAAQEVESFLLEAEKNLSPQLLGIVKNNANDVLEVFKEGDVSGKKLNSLISSLMTRAKTAEGDAKTWIGDLGSIVDDALKSNLDEASKAALEEASLKWRNIRTIEPLLEKSPYGDINPTDLMQRIAGSKYIRASTSGAGKDPLIDLARLGKILVKPGGSDTFEKSAYSLGAYSLTGAGAATDLGTTGVTLLANRLLQDGVLRNQALIARALKDSPKSQVFLNPSKRMGLISALGKSQER